MEISDEAAPRATVENSIDSSIHDAFRETLGLIHIALVAHYGLHDSEATELEKDLLLWFVRFCKRPGSQTPRASRSFLLVACCQFAREYQKYVIGTGARETDSKLDSLLAREPADVARDFGRSLELITYRTHPDA